MSLDKFTDLELTRILKNLLNEVNYPFSHIGRDLINQFNNLPTEYEFAESVKELKKQLEKVSNRMMNETQKYVRKIRTFYDDDTSKYEGVIHNDFYSFEIDKFIDYSYEVSRFLEDNCYELMPAGINQTLIDNYNASLFDLRELNTIYQNKLNKYTETKKNIINNIKNMINLLWL